MRRSRNKRVWLLAAGLAVSAVVAGAGTARMVAEQFSGKSITAVRIARSNESVEIRFAGGAFVDIPGATGTITIGTRSRGIVLIQFSASTSCSRDAGSDRPLCHINARMTPPPDADPKLVVFDSLSSGADGADPPEAHAMQWSTDVLGPGTYTVQMQGAVGPDSTFHLWRWHLTVLRVRV